MLEKFPVVRPSSYAGIWLRRLHWFYNIKNIHRSFKRESHVIKHQGIFYVVNVKTMLVIILTSQYVCFCDISNEMEKILNLPKRLSNGLNDGSARFSLCFTVIFAGWRKQHYFYSVTK